MDIHPTSSVSSERIARLVSLLEELVSTETSSLNGSDRARASKMIFSTVKQRGSQVLLSMTATG